MPALDQEIAEQWIRIVVGAENLIAADSGQENARAILAHQLTQSGVITKRAQHGIGSHNIVEVLVARRQQAGIFVSNVYSDPAEVILNAANKMALV